MGDGKDFDSVKIYLLENNIENINLVGSIFDSLILQKYYNQSDVFLFPSHHEGFPRVLYEAMYFELPILTTFVGNVPGLFKDGFNALELEVKSVDSIIINLKRIPLNNDLKNKISSQAKISLIQYFNDSKESHLDLFLKNTLNYAK